MKYYILEAYSFDDQCMKLAEYFLPPDASKTVKWDLAQAIQDAVEEYLRREGY